MRTRQKKYVCFWLVENETNHKTKYYKLKMNIPENKTLQELFEWRFDKTPDSIAHKFLDREKELLEVEL